MAAAEVAIVIRAKNEASKAFEDVIRDMKRMKVTSQDAFSVMNRVGKTAFLGIAAGASVAAVGLLKFTQAAAAEQANVAKLTTQIRTLDVAQQKSAANVEQVIKQREKLAFADDQLRDSLTLLISQTGDYEESLKRQRIAMDLSRGTGLDLQLASKLVGKVTEENIEVLKRYGITIGKGATETEALAIIQGRFAGQSEAYAKTAAGQWERVTNEFQNMQETIGAALLPVVTKLGLALADFLAKHEGTFQRIGQGIADFVDAATEAATKITQTLKPAFEFLDKGDRVAILSALAAVIAGPLVVAVIAFGVASAIAFATNPITQFILAIALITVAITLVVRHWDQIWAGMQKAPEALLNWFKSGGWKDIALFFISPVALLVKYWDKIFASMPRPVQEAMNTVAGFIEEMVNRALIAINKLIDGVNKLIDGLNKVNVISDDIGHIPTIGEVDFTNKIARGSGAGGFARAFEKVADAAVEGIDRIRGQVALVGPGFDAYAGGVGDTGDAAEGAAKQLTILEAAMDGVITRAEAMTLGLTEQQAAQLELAVAHEAVLDEEFRRRVELNALALAYPGLTGEEVKFRIGLEAIAEHLRRTGESIQKFILDTSTQVLEGFQSAFDQIFNKPTKEDSQLQLQLLEAERRRLLSPNATESQKKAMDAEIDRIQNLIAIRRNADDITKTRAAIADNTALTDEAQANAAELYIAAIDKSSTEVEKNAGVMFLQTLATIGLKDQTLSLTTAFANLNDAVSNTTPPPLSLADALKALHALPDHGQSLLPSFATGTNFVPRDMIAKIHRGERITPAWQNTQPEPAINITTYITADSEASESAMQKLAKIVEERAETAVRKAAFRGSYVTSGAYTPS